MMNTTSENDCKTNPSEISSPYYKWADSRENRRQKIFKLKPKKCQQSSIGVLNSLTGAFQSGIAMRQNLRIGADMRKIADICAYMREYAHISASFRISRIRMAIANFNSK